MKVAVLSHRMTGKVEQNITVVTHYINEAIVQKANLILFSETATTGLSK